MSSLCCYVLDFPRLRSASGESTLYYREQRLPFRGFVKASCHMCTTYVFLSASEIGPRICTSVHTKILVQERYMYTSIR